MIRGVWVLGFGNTVERHARSIYDIIIDAVEGEGISVLALRGPGGTTADGAGIVVPCGRYLLRVWTIG